MPRLATSTELEQPSLNPKWVNGVSGIRYRIQTAIAEGGMGVIYRAISDSGKQSVVKFAKKGFDEAIIRELGLNLVVVPVEAGFAQLTDYGRYGKSKKPFLVFCDIEGQTLRKYTPTRLIDCYQIARKLGELLTTVHARGYVHGDISDKNVLVTAELEPVLIDFGLGTASGEYRLGFTEAFDSHQSVASASSDLASLQSLYRYLLNKLTPGEGDSNAVATHQSLASKALTIGDFCDQLVKLEYKLIEDSCRKPLSITPDNAPLEMAEAWTRFVQLTSGLIEYQAKSEEEPFGGPPESTTEEADLRNTDQAARLLERWQFQRSMKQNDQLMIARFCRAYASHLGAHGRNVEEAFYNHRAIEIFQRAGFPTNEDELEYSRYLNLHGHILVGFGRHTEAAAAFIRSLVVRARHEPGDSPLVAQCFNNISNAFNKFLGGDSIALYLEAKKYWTGAFGPKNSHRSWALHNIGRILSKGHNHEAAIAVTKIALEMKGQSLGDTHPQVAFVQVNLAQQYGRRLEFEESFRLFSLADKLRNDCYGYGRPATLFLVKEWAKNLIAAKEYKKAYDLLKSRYSEDHLRTNNYDVGDILSLLADVCLRLRKPVEAKRFALDSDAYKSILPEKFIEVGGHQKAFAVASVHIDEESQIYWRRYFGQMIVRDDELLSPKRRLEAQDLLD
jgi:serine/threonine protein kinase